MTITGKTRVAGIAGSPVTQSMSPVLHNAWIAAAGLDAVYVPFAPHIDGFTAFIAGLRGGSVAGLNVTIPFKQEALALADEVSALARRAGAANLLVFRADGTVAVDNTDGPGMLSALTAKAGFDVKSGPAVILGAGGGARGAAAALLEAGSPGLRIVNRTRDRAVELARAVGGPIEVLEETDLAAAFADAALILNTTSLGMGGGPGPVAPFDRAPDGAVVMDMVYKPLETRFLKAARARGLKAVDGLEMLIRQAVPSFEAFFGQAPPAGVDVRALAVRQLGDAA